VWIIWIGLAPLLQNLFIEWFLFLNVSGPARAYRLMLKSTQSRVSVLTDSAITALVFTHALRARIINKPEDARAPEPDKAVQLPKSRDGTDPTTEAALSTEGAQAPESQPAGEDSQVDVETVHSRAESSATAASTLGPANGDDGRDAKKAKKADKTKQTPDLLGRLDNLVTGDLQSIGNAKSWPQLRESPADYPAYDAEALMMLLQWFELHCCWVLARGCSLLIAIAQVHAAPDGSCTRSSAGRPGSDWP
jgi:hypothetical protein